MVTWVLQIKRLVSNVKYLATITLSRTEIKTPNTLTKHALKHRLNHAWNLPLDLPIVLNSY